LSDNTFSGPLQVVGFEAAGTPCMSGRAVRGIFRIASSEKMRYSLQLVQIRTTGRKKKKTIVVATDGRRFIHVVMRGAGPEGTVYLHRDVLPSIKVTDRVYFLDKSIAAVRGKKGKETVTTIPYHDDRDVVYPDWKGIVPAKDRKKAQKIGVGTKVVGGLLSSMEDVLRRDKHDHPFVVWDVGQPHEVIRFRGGRSDFRVLGLAMPVSIN